MAAGIVVLLGGCAAPVQPTPTTSTIPPTSSSPSPSAAPTATNEPLATEEAGPEAGGLDERSAYRLCIEKVGDGVESQGWGPFEPVGFEGAEVLRRDDGYFWVWADFTSGSGADQRDIASAQCVLGGAVDSPDWIMMGETLRSMRDEIDPNFDLSAFGS